MVELNQRQHRLLSANKIRLKQCIQAVFLSVSCCVMSLTVAADAGQQLDNSTSVAESELAEGVAAAAREAARQVENLLREVDVLRRGISAQVAEDGNTWHAGIAESQLALGVAYQSLDDHPAALIELERAVHINRVNHGLFALQQVPAILLQVESHMAMNDWQAADERMQYAFYVHTQALAENEVEMIPALIDYAHWQLSAYMNEQGGIPSVRLVDAYQLLRVADSILDRSPSPEAYPRVSFLRQMAYIAWLIGRSDLGNWLESDVLDARVVNDDWVMQMTGEDYVSTRSSYLMGESALQQAVALRQAQYESIATGTPESDQSVLRYAEAVKQLADWNLIFERRYEAVELYEQSWSLLATINDEVANQSFQRVTMLPIVPVEDMGKGHNEIGLTVPGYTRAFMEKSSLIIISNAREQSQVTLGFEINRFGRPAHVEVLEVVPEDNQDFRRLVVSLVQSRKFRPWLIAGETQDSPKLTKSFSLGIERPAEATQ